MTYGKNRKNRKNFQVFSPLEFLAAITQHIPEQSFQLVRYYGWYSNRMRGDRKRRQDPVEEDSTRQVSDSGVINIVIAFVRNTHFSPFTEIDDLESKANESNNKNQPNFCVYSDHIQHISRMWPG